MMKQRIKKYAWIAAYYLSSVLIVYYVYKYFYAFKEIFSLHFLPYFLLALILHGFAYFSAACAWVYMVRKHHDVKGIKLLRSYYVSQITRYIPGNIWSFLARFDNNKKLGVPGPATAYFLAIENLALIGVAFVFSILALSLFSHNYILPLIGVALVLGIAIWIVFISPKYFRKIVELITKKFKSKANFSELSNWDIIVVVLFYTLYWTLFGLSFYFTYVGLARSTVSLILALGINAAAWLIGYMSIITPSGLGVREGVIVFMLKNAVSSIVALNIAIVFRFIFTLAEALGLIIILFIDHDWSREKKKIHHINRYWASLIVIIIVYVAYFSFITIVRNHNLYSGRFDLGDMDQTIWNTLHGNFFSLMSPDSDKFVSRMAYHSDLLLVLISPIYWIYESVNSLLVLQSIVIGIGAIPLFILGKKILKNNLAALLIAIAFLFYPALQRVNFYDFHPVSLCITLFLFAFLYIYERKYLLAFIFSCIAILTKEEIGLVVFLLGVYIIWKMKNWKIGMLFVLTGLLSSALFILVLIPHFRPHDSAHFALIFYSQFGGDTPTKTLEGMLLHPSALFSSIFSFSTIVYVLELLFPAGFLSIFSLPTLLLSSSEFLINTLSNNYYMKTIYLQYTSAIIPFVFISSVFGADFMIKKFGQFYKKRFLWIKIPFSIFISIYILICSIIGSLVWGVLPVGAQNVMYIFSAKDGTQVINKIENLIPAKYSVSASNSIAPHFTHRKNIYTFPVDATNADFVILLKNETFEIVDQDTFDDALEYIEKSKTYNEVFKEGNLYIFQKATLNFPLKEEIYQ